MEWILAVFAAVAVGKVANLENKSPWLWGGLAFVLCVASFFTVPLPFLRVFIAAVLTFILMMATNLLRKA